MQARKLKREGNWHVGQNGKMAQLYAMHLDTINRQAGQIAALTRELADERRRRLQLESRLRSPRRDSQRDIAP